MSEDHTPSTDNDSDTWFGGRRLTGFAALGVLVVVGSLVLQTIFGVETLREIACYTAWAVAGLCLIGLVLVGTTIAFRPGGCCGPSTRTWAPGVVFAVCLLVGSVATLVGSTCLSA